MLELKDFFHLPEVDALVAQLLADRPGLVIVAGLDARATPPGSSATSDAFLPSGRAAIFGILARRLLAGRSTADGAAVVVSAAKGAAVRLPDGQRGRIERVTTLADAARFKPSLLIVDELTDDNVTAVCRTAAQDVRVLAQLDCVFAGAQVARHLMDLGASLDTLRGLADRAWVVSVQRIPALCPQCRQVAELHPGRAAEFQLRYPDLQLTGSFYSAGDGCTACGGSGFSGDVAAFDFYRAPETVSEPGAGRRSSTPQLLAQRSLFSLEEYLLRLALLGRVALDDVFSFDATQLRRTYRLLAAGERALAAANTALRGRLLELETAHRVLEQRSQSLQSLQDTAQALSASADLDDLANRICRQVRNLCGADRVILYLLRPDMEAEVLAVNGWDQAVRGLRLAALAVFGEAAAPNTAAAGAEPARFAGWPPGIAPVNPDVAGATLRSGLRVPLIAQHEVVGLMIVHSTTKPRFAASETAMLQALANQAAVAIQRTGLIEALQGKIVALQAAQAELIQKERLERELELARQVQQSLLPRVFPVLPGYRFAAASEAARRVGGDLYDVFRIDDGHIGVAVADVSDKGMPAALFMALTRSLLLAEARRALSPRQVLSSVHRLLLELGDPEMFVTVFYGVVDVAAHTLTYVRAGHEEGLLLRDGDIRPLAGQGIFLGLLEAQDLPLSEECVILQPADRLVVYTDGIIDALAPTGEAFGLARLQEFLRQNASLAPGDLCAAAFKRLRAFQGSAEQFDDMTLLAIAVD